MSKALSILAYLDPDLALLKSKTTITTTAVWKSHKREGAVLPNNLLFYYVLLFLYFHLLEESWSYDDP